MENINIELLYKDVFPIIMRVAFNITGSTEISEEICQEAFIKYYEKGQQIPTMDQAKYWLIRVAKNLSLNYAKKRGKEFKLITKLNKERVKEEESGETKYIRKEEKIDIHKALQQIPYNLRITLLLREFCDMNYKAIAETLKLTEENVKVRIFRAREKLGKILAEGVYDVS